VCQNNENNEKKQHYCYYIRVGRVFHQNRGKPLSNMQFDPSAISKYNYLSGCRDLNPGPPAPKAGALAELRYIPIIASLTAFTM
jgi:hypothetical protein